MTDPQTTKMLQAILNGQTALKEDLIKRIDKVDIKVDKLEDKLDKADQRLTQVEKRLTKRIDKLGTGNSHIWKTTRLPEKNMMS